jgi:hypothetical protein
MSNAGGMSTVTRYTDMLAGNTVWNPWSPDGAYDALATVTLSATTASIEFAGIPSTYKHLQIRSISRESTGTISQQYLRFNGDTATNYSIHTLTGNGASAGTAGSAGANQPYINCGIKTGSSDLANTFGVAVIDILDYADTTKNKTVRTLSGVDLNGSGYAWMSSGAWRNTSAITKIVLTAEVASFVQYSQFTLYGVK